MNYKSYGKFIQENPRIVELDPHDLPKDLVITTITQTCKLPVNFNVVSIAKRIPLSKNFIHTVKCGNCGEICRSIIPINERKIRKKKKYVSLKKNIKPKKNFYNQVSIVVSTPEKIKMNVKLFRNGSLQITGGVNISSVIWVIDQIFKLIQNMSTSRITYVFPIIFLNIMELYDYSIGMINSNFNIGFRIKRNVLFEKLTSDGFDCSFDSARYAGVKLRYYTNISNVSGVSNKQQTKTNNEEIIEHASTIPVFESGAVIITGSRNFKELVMCYKFINTYLIENYEKIVLL